MRKTDMEDSECLERLIATIADAWREGCPVAGAGRRSELAATALRRWRSFPRRSKPGRSRLDDRVEDLAKGLRDSLEADSRLVGPLMEDYRYFAKALARMLVEQEGLERE